MFQVLNLVTQNWKYIEFDQKVNRYLLCRKLIAFFVSKILSILEVTQMRKPFAVPETAHSLMCVRSPSLAGHSPLAQLFASQLLINFWVMRKDWTSRELRENECFAWCDRPTLTKIVYKVCCLSAGGAQIRREY
jgi:hypothetical protein